MFANLINGEWVQSAHAIVNRNPSDLSDVIGEYASADRQQTLDAIAAARQAAPAWAATTPQQRFDILDRAGSEILARKEELGRLLSREEGKILAEGIGEVVRAGNIFKYFAGECLRQHGEVLDSVRPGIEVNVTREPLGVVGIIAPWNFPIAIPAWKIAPALAYGNAVVFKPASVVPASSWALADILHRAGVPAGVFNLVMGSGREVGDVLLNAGLDGISFTGSQDTGKKVAAACLGSGSKFQLEMGGKNPLVVLDDADLKLAVEAAINGAYFSTGQRCTASSRLVVTAGIHDAFVEAMVSRLKTLKVGDALDISSHIGPVVDAGQLQQDLDYVGIATAEGGQLAYGGERLQAEKDGYYMSPALITGTHNQMRINREEVFGPVASVIKVADFEEALAIANDTPFGLVSGICTQSLKLATQFRRRAAAGMVMVNLPTAGVDYHVPFGGRKGSSYGPREQGRYAAEFYTTVKTAYVAA